MGGLGCTRCHVGHGQVLLDSTQPGPTPSLRADVTQRLSSSLSCWWPTNRSRSDRDHCHDGCAGLRSRRAALLLPSTVDCGWWPRSEPLSEEEHSGWPPPPSVTVTIGHSGALRAGGRLSAAGGRLDCWPCEGYGKSGRTRTTAHLPTIWPCFGAGDNCGTKRPRSTLEESDRGDARGSWAVVARSAHSVAP